MLANDLPFPRALFQSAPFTSLAPSEQLGLLRLFLAAWDDPGGRLPNDARQLTALAGVDVDAGRLGELLGTWLAADGDHLVCLPLQEAVRRRETWRAKSALGGHRSGEARRRKVARVQDPVNGASNHPSPPPPTSNHPSDGASNHPSPETPVPPQLPTPATISAPGTLPNHPSPNVPPLQGSFAFCRFDDMRTPGCLTTYVVSAMVQGPAGHMAPGGPPSRFTPTTCYSSSSLQSSQEKTSCQVVGPKPLPPDLIERLSGLRPVDDSDVFERHVTAAVCELGYTVRRQSPVSEYYAEGKDGFIDLELRRDGEVLFVELDRQVPRKHSIGKLQQIKCEVPGSRAIIMLRDPRETPPQIPRIDLVLAVHGDLIGQPVRSKGSWARASQGDRSIVMTLVEEYVAKVQTSWRANTDCYRAVHRLICEGQSVDSIRRATDHYAEYCERVGTAAEFRKAARNFFGKSNSDWLRFVSAETQPSDPLQNFAQRIRDLQRELPEWYPAWGQRHAERFAFRMPGDPSIVAAWWPTFERQEITAAALEHASLVMTSIDLAGFSRSEHRTKLVSLARGYRAPASPPAQGPPATPPTQAPADSPVRCAWLEISQQIPAAELQAAIGADSLELEQLTMKQRGMLLSAAGFLFEGESPERVLRRLRAGAAYLDPLRLPLEPDDSRGSDERVSSTDRERPATEALP